MDKEQNTEIKSLKSLLASQDTALRSLEKDGALWRAQKAAFEHRVDELEAEAGPLRAELQEAKAQANAAKSIAVVLKTELRRLRRAYKEQEMQLKETEKNLGKLMAHPPQASVRVCHLKINR